MGDIMIDVKFNLVNDKEKQIFGILPKRAEHLATGYDAFNCGPDLAIKPFEHVLIPLGFKAFIPEGWWLFLAPRGSTHAKKHLHTLYGVIDEGYEGNWFFSSQYIPIQKVYGKDPVLKIKYGDAIAQIIVMPRYEMNIVEATDDEFKKLCMGRGAMRKAGAFGSTDGQ